MMTVNSDKACFMQLHNPQELNEVQLAEIAALIYDTDYLIYPAMFNSRDEAIIILSESIRRQDAMFCLDNCYVAMYEGSIIGLILWCMGPLIWNRSSYYKCLEDLGFPAPPLLDQVASDYLESYSDIEENTVALINVCVDENYQGYGIGGLLLHNFIENFSKPHTYDLHVLADNPPALSIYGREGFSIVDTDQAYLSDDVNELCHHMVRPCK